MRQLRMLATGLAAAFLLVACGAQNGPSAAENEALAAISGIQKVVSYPIPAANVLSYQPAGERAVGTPAYAFTVRRHGSPKPAWVIAGPSGAKLLRVFPDLAAAAAHAAFLQVPAALLKIVARGAVGRLKLSVVAAHVQQVPGQNLRKLGLKLPGASYQVLAVVALPSNPGASQLDVAHFVLAQGKVVGEYGGSR